MKFIMTGHTSPIGSVLYKHLLKDHDVIGVSRQTGFDLTEFDTLKKVVELSVDADHFINLASINSIQSQLLLLIHDKWKKVNKSGNIISFGTLGTKLDEKILKEINGNMQYFKDKQHLEAIHNRLCIEDVFGEQPKSILIRILNYGEKSGARAGEPSCNADDIIRIFDFIVNEKMYVSSIDARRI